jgi:hypothetical protein
MTTWTRRTAVALLTLILTAAPAAAQDEKDRRINELEERLDAMELELMRVQAMTDIVEEDDGPLEEKRFSGAARSLQVLNPEISFSGDFVAQYLVGPNGKEYLGDERSGFMFREFGVHFQSNLDPFSMTKIAFAFTESEVALEEAFMTWSPLLEGFSLTVGNFRQQLGVVNRWHPDALDQSDHPLMLSVPFGEAGLVQTGLSAHLRLPPLWTHSLELVIEVTNSSNENVLSGEFFSIPSTLAHVTNYWDLSPSTYLELGLTGLFGANNGRGVPDAAGGLVDERFSMTAMGGADLTLSWEPVNQAKYRGFTWRSEFLYIRKELPGEDRIDWFGGYSYMEVKVAQPLMLGIRGDLVQPFEVKNADEFEWQVVPYVTWWQSEFVRLRLEYRYHQPWIGEMDHKVLLQLSFAAGPHKHERY